MLKNVSPTILIILVILSFVCSTPTNNLCSSAEDLSDVVGAIRVSVDLTGAGLSTTEVISCSLTSFSRYTVWYTFESKENTFLSASFCDNGKFTGNPSFYLLKGNCLDNTCEALNDDACHSLGAALEVSILPNTRYFLVLASTQAGEQDFYFSLSKPSAISNDNCISAVPLVSGEVYVASVFTASYDNLGLGCPSFASNTPNVWYSFNSLDYNIVDISFCGTDSNSAIRNFVDPVIYLLEGTCGAATCLQYNDDSCGKLPSLYVEVHQFTDYLVAIGSSESTTPFSLEFTFTLSSLESEIDDSACSNSEYIDSPNTLIVGTLIGAEIDPTNVNIDGIDFSVCSNIDLLQNNVFYYFNSETYNHLIINHCNVLGHITTVAPVNFVIYTGSCQNLVCVASRVDLCGLYGGELTINIEQHTDYYIAVYGPAVDFMFDINLKFELTNDNCDSAVEVHKGNLYSSSSVHATIDGSVFCFIPSPNVWYSFTTSEYDAYAIISFCRNGAATTYDNFISVTTGGCGAATCVAFDDNSCGFAPEIFIDVEKNTQYFFEVGVKGFKGEFTFFFDLLTANDLCETAEEITPGIISGSTVGSSSDAVSGVCGVPISQKDGNVWYQFNSGLYSNVILSNCEQELASHTNFDIEIFLYLGVNCNELVCVGGVDDSLGCGTGATLKAALLPNTNYYIAISGTGSGDFQFRFTLE